METVYLKVWVTPSSQAILTVFLAVLVIMFAMYAVKMIAQWFLPG